MTFSRKIAYTAREPTLDDRILVSETHNEETGEEEHLPWWYETSKDEVMKSCPRRTDTGVSCNINLSAVSYIGLQFMERGAILVSYEYRRLIFNGPARNESQDIFHRVGVVASGRVIPFHECLSVAPTASANKFSCSYIYFGAITRVKAKELGLGLFPRIWGGGVCGALELELPRQVVKDPTLSQPHYSIS